MTDGALRVLDGSNIGRLRPNMTSAQRSRAEILWDYGSDYWNSLDSTFSFPQFDPSAVVSSSPLAVLGYSVSIWYRGDRGQPWYSGRVVSFEGNGVHSVLFSDGELSTFDLLAEFDAGQLRWGRRSRS